MLMVCSASVACCPSVLLVSNNSHFAMVHRIEASLFSQPSPRPKISHVLVDQIKEPEQYIPPSDVELIVTFGAESLETILKSNPQKPVLSILIRKNTYLSLLAQYQKESNTKEHAFSAIYLDHPIERQLNLIQLIFNDLDQKGAIGVLFGPGSIHQQEELLSIAEKQKLKLNTIYVNNFENPVAVMDAFLDEVKVLLAIPDNRIFNPHTARGILLAAFHKHVPLIGYSQTYVKNGALISLYSTTKQIAQQTAQAILTTLDQKILPAPQSPTDFSIEVNYQVARSLHINMESEASLYNKLLAVEPTRKSITYAKKQNKEERT